MNQIIEILADYFHNYEWLKSASIFFIVVLSILLIRWLLGLLIKNMKKHNNPIISESETALISLLNWVTIYGILIFILFYFFNSKWIKSEIASIGSVTISPFLIIVAILIITFANRASKTITKYLLPRVYGRYQLDRGVQFTFNRMFHYSIMVLAFIISISTVGIDLSALTVFAGVVGVGIGFGLQNIASNFISGIIILFERPIKVGDRVIVNDIIGDVEKINMRATVIKSINNEHIIVPNSYFLEEHVVNRSYSDPTMRLTIPIGVAYGSDVEKVRDLLLQVAKDEAEISPSMLLDPEPFVNFVGFGDSSLDFELFVWISNPNEIIVTKSNINFRINNTLHEHNIEIPFPQRDLHIRSIDNDTIRSLKN
ncbi:mechanosensitive ion channel [Aquibacillus koreensis]|uniref:Mechanosensitive ion channel n=1 Tax=Aquibacillus koreensis TaxID=279446 RepID=A0A9X3WLW3_9BACI|nr:mechanosensitive ion channel domain-containing protein [Aquibacillus koreensis]MCT2537797.1 mechanosensitive ion channel [Aquibacillus koreensis]MDC3421170.1 mechanosensitive ion channel [Aquibacillus koreensis]